MEPGQARTPRAQRYLGPRCHQGSWVPNEVPSCSQGNSHPGPPLGRHCPLQGARESPCAVRQIGGNEKCPRLLMTALPSGRKSLFWESSNLHVWARSLGGGWGRGCCGAQAPVRAAMLCLEVGGNKGDMSGAGGTSKPPPPQREWEPKNCSQGGCSSASPGWAAPGWDRLRHPRAARSARLLAPKYQQGRGRGEGEKEPDAGLHPEPPRRALVPAGSCPPPACAAARGPGRLGGDRGVPPGAAPSVVCLGGVSAPPPPSQAPPPPFLQAERPTAAC